MDQVQEVLEDVGLSDVYSVDLSVAELPPKSHVFGKLGDDRDIEVTLNSAGTGVEQVRFCRFAFGQRTGFDPDQLFSLIPVIAQSEFELIGERNTKGILFVQVRHVVELVMPDYKPIRRRIAENEDYDVKPSDLKRTGRR